MNILYLSHRVPFPADKGEKIRTFHQLAYLAEQGHALTVFSPLETKAEQAFCDGLARALPVKVGSSGLAASVWRKCLALITHKPMSVTHFYSRRLQRQLDRHLAAQPVDAIVCTSSAMADYVFRSNLLQTRAGRDKPRLIMDFMDLDSDKWRQYQQQSKGLMRWVYGREAQLLSAMEQRIYHAFDACLFISENEVSLFSKTLGEQAKLHVCANGLDTTAFYPPANPVEKPQGPNLLFTGVMNYKPNEDAVLWFVETQWPAVRARWPEAQFVIAGMTPSARVQALAGQDGIEVTGYINDILPCYHKADVFVAPFRLARGVQNKILQAFACGVPVVTTGKGAEGIACAHNEHLLIGETPESLVQHIDQLARDSNLSQRLTNNALKLVQESYSWQGQLAGLGRLISQPPMQEAR